MLKRIGTGFLRLKHLSYNLAIHRNVSNQILHKLKERGLLVEVYPNKDEVHDEFSKQQTIYAGFDPTSDSLHVGNLLVIIGLLHYLRDGHRVICIIGDSTAKIGDPTDKHEIRPALDDETIDKNSMSMSSTINKIFANHLKHFWKIDNASKKSSSICEPIILFNGSWYRKRNITDFLSTIGRNINVSRMLKRKFVEDRLDQGLTFSEFAYQIFQAYDWYYLLVKYRCKFQLGGNDQLGNIYTGYDLIKKLEKDETCYGLTTPLILNEDLQKFGKSTGDAIWLNRNKLSPFNFYQFFLRKKDDEVEYLLKLFTFHSLDYIEAIMQKHFKCPENRHAQKKLAESLTRLVHGEDGLETAKKATKAIYESDLESVGMLEEKEMFEIFGREAIKPVFHDPGETTVLDFCMKASFFFTERDAIQIIKAGGFHLNHKLVKVPSRKVTKEDILPNQTSLIRIGKKRYYILRWM